MNIDLLVSHFSDLWDNSPLEHTFSSKVYSIKEKAKYEANLKKNYDRIREVKKYSSKAEFKESFFSEFGSILKSFFGFQNDEQGIVISDEFTRATEKFIKMAKDFDNKITEESIAQAARNLWVMNVIQHLFGLKVEITPSIFAYSMLYPYCDNYLDENGRSARTKNHFAELITKKLKGEVVRPDSDTKRIFTLLDMIESQYERKKYPDIYDSLLGIHSAQIKSPSLNKNSNLSKNEIQYIGIEKGGTSVMADGYLALGDLDENQQRFLFGYGVYLQFIDNLQDIGDDLKMGISTIFTIEQKENQLDEITNKLFNFGDILSSEYFPVDDNSVRELMFRTAKLLTLECVGKSGKYYNTQNLNELEKYSPVSFKFLNENKKKASGNVSIKKMTKYIMFSEAFAS